MLSMSHAILSLESKVVGASRYKFAEVGTQKLVYVQRLVLQFNFAPANNR